MCNISRHSGGQNKGVDGILSHSPPPRYLYLAPPHESLRQKYNAPDCIISMCSNYKNFPGRVTAPLYMLPNWEKTPLTKPYTVIRLPVTN